MDRKTVPVMPAEKQMPNNWSQALQVIQQLGIDVQVHNALRQSCSRQFFVSDTSSSLCDHRFCLFSNMI